jgi:hypothetical protein
LSFMKSEIRLLRLDKSEDESAIVSCCLETISLVKPIPYTALSYCWGDSQVTCGILINGVLVKVTTNLEAALRHLRMQNVGWLWADAICINQNDAEEKSLQVMRMNLIFRKAAKVIVWLGIPDHPVDQAVQFIEKLSNLSREKIYLRAPEIGTVYSSGDRQAEEALGSWEALQDLFDMPYWKRVWIIREVSVAHEIEIYCGKYGISWDKFNQGN